MSKRKEPKITTGLYRYIIGIFNHYYTRGMNIDSARIKAFDETYKVIAEIAVKEENVPDHLAVLTIEHAVSTLRKRGQQISLKLSVEKDEEQITLYRNALQELKQAIDDNERFIKNYRGETTNG